MYYAVVTPEIQHHGVKGQRWGVRRDNDIKEAKLVYKNAKKDLKEKRKTLNKNADKILGVFKDPKQKDLKNYEKAKNKVESSRFNLELKKSQRKGKPTSQYSKLYKKRVYDKEYDKAMKKFNDSDKAHTYATNKQAVTKVLLKAMEN